MVEGENIVVIYTLSTCGWCKKLKKLLTNLEIDFQYVDVDKLDGDALNNARDEVKKYNPRGSYPTMVINNGESVVVGFNEDSLTPMICKYFSHHSEDHVRGAINKC